MITQTPGRASGPPFDLVLFDLGGVLVELRGMPAMLTLVEGSTEDDIRDRWLDCEWVRRFERGHCDPASFAAGVVETWGLGISPEAFLADFATWPDHLHDGAAELVAAVRGRTRVGCLSNTNDLHWSMQRSRFGLDGLFDLTLLSHELQLVKPDVELFQAVPEATGVPASRTLFLDDNDPNVLGARAAGFLAERVRGVEEARAALRRHGVLP